MNWYEQVENHGLGDISDSVGIHGGKVETQQEMKICNSG